MTQYNQSDSEREKNDRKKAEELLNITEEAERKAKVIKDFEELNKKNRSKAENLLRDIEAKEKELDKKNYSKVNYKAEKNNFKKGFKKDLGIFYFFIEGIRKTFNFNGNSTREEFCYFFLLDLLILFLLSRLENLLLFAIWFYLGSITSLSLGIRRLRDGGKSGWWTFFPFPLPFWYWVFAKKSIRTNAKRKTDNQSFQNINNNNFEERNLFNIIVEKIAGIGEAEGLGKFSLKQFFGGVQRKYSEEEFVKNIFVGTKGTTPSIKAVSTEYPQPWIFSRLIILSLVIFYAFKFAYDQSPNPIYIPALIITGSFGIPLSTLVLFLELNIRRNIPIWTIGKLFLAGAVLSLFINQVFFENTLTFLGWAGASAAGVTEEPAKLVALVLLARGKKRYPYILNGLLLGAAVGCGFAAFESAGYAYNNRQYYDVFFSVITIRGILSPFAHIVWTAVAGAALWRVKKGGNFSLELLKKKAFYAPFLTVTLCHAIWNSPIQLPLYGTQIISGLISWIVALSLLNLGIKQIDQEKAGKEIFNKSYS